ncbi:MAG: hydrogenase expression/formation C-terminal domain-containing protein [Thiogranum sp.]|nr:hydrogenase expression/formation C-terminal domain-containing protein [Thiogranum sp.]
MDKAGAIAIEIEPAAITTGNVLPLLHELQHALLRFQIDGSEHCIDVNSLPLSEQDHRQLESVLGRGEVHARLQALGDSEITETRIPGIWRVVHANAEGAVVGRFLEVTACPSILKTQQPDITDGIAHLQRLIDELPGADQ